MYNQYHRPFFCVRVYVCAIFQITKQTLPKLQALPDAETAGAGRFCNTPVMPTRSNDRNAPLPLHPHLRRVGFNIPAVFPLCSEKSRGFLQKRSNSAQVRPCTGIYKIAKYSILCFFCIKPRPVHIFPVVAPLPIGRSADISAFHAVYEGSFFLPQWGRMKNTVQNFLYIRALSSRFSS